MVGIDFRDSARQLYLGIARSNIGFQNLNAFLSHHKHEDTPLPEQAPELAEVFFIYPYQKLLGLDNIKLKINEYIGVSINDLKQLKFSPLQNFKEKFVVLNTYTFNEKQDFNTHRLLRAIDNNVLLSTLPVSEQANEHDRYLPMATIQKAYAEYDYILKNTERLLADCTIEFDFSANRKHQNKKLYSTSAEEDRKLINKLCLEGLPKRYPKITRSIKERLEKRVASYPGNGLCPFLFDQLGYRKLCKK